MELNLPDLEKDLHADFCLSVSLKSNQSYRLRPGCVIEEPQDIRDV